MRLSSRSQRALVLLPLLLTQIGCDQATKELAQRELMGKGPLSFLGGFFKLVYVENPGAFLGMGGALGEELRFWTLTVGIAVGLAAGLAVLFGRKDLPIGSAVAGALVAAGGLGNLIDRMAQEGRVSDFMLFELGPLRTGVLNVADVQIFAGVVLLVVLARRESPALRDEQASG